MTLTVLEYMIANAEASYREREFNAWFNMEPIVAPNRDGIYVAA